MRKALVATLAILAFATSAMAQGYDLYYVLPSEAGSKGIDVGLSAADISSIGDVGIVNAMGKYSISDQLEVGALAELGVLIDGADALSRVTVGPSTVWARAEPSQSASSSSMRRPKNLACVSVPCTPSPVVI
jgi:hypothetical protein